MRNVLILSASFGEGHNTAARSITTALNELPSTRTFTTDIYLETTPFITKIVQSAYSFTINKLPNVWNRIYNFLDQSSNIEDNFLLSKKLCKKLASIYRHTQPHVIVSTYPMYSYLIHSLKKSGDIDPQIPMITIVTDSRVVNRSWYRFPSDIFCVPDEETKTTLIEQGNVSMDKIQVTGFPVALQFNKLAFTPEPEATFKVLYLPSSRISHSFSIIQELLKIPFVKLTVVTGHFQKLHQYLIKNLCGKEVNIIGWTNKIPELLCSHHIYIGKAGGAIVHEALAARCPIMISHIVRGQEEGNTSLIQDHNIGPSPCLHPQEVSACIIRAFANNATLWKEWRKNFENISYPDASYRIARLISLA